MFRRVPSILRSYEPPFLFTLSKVVRSPMHKNWQRYLSTGKITLRRRWIYISAFGGTIRADRASAAGYSMHWFPCKMQVIVNRNQSGVTLRPVFELALVNCVKPNPLTPIENSHPRKREHAPSLQHSAHEDPNRRMDARVNVLHFNLLVIDIQLDVIARGLISL